MNRSHIFALSEVRASAGVIQFSDFALAASISLKEVMSDGTSLGVPVRRWATKPSRS